MLLTEAVTAVEINHDTGLHDLRVWTTRGTAVVHITASHLFWDPMAGRWVQAVSLYVGEPLKTPDGSSVTADGGATLATPQGWMWDLTVPRGNDHDFYVVASSSTAVLVHNCGGVINGHDGTCTCEGVGEITWAPTPSSDEAWDSAGKAGAPSNYDIARSIAKGHAGSAHAGDFPGMTTDDPAGHVQNILDNPGQTQKLDEYRIAFSDGATVVIFDANSPDLGTVFKPTSDEYWEGLL